MSFTVTSAGSLPSAAAAISPRFSRSSGGIHGRRMALKTSSSVRPATRRWPRKTPYSLIFSLRRTASVRTATLCALEPVK